MRSHLNQIEVLLAGELQGLLDPDDSDLFAIGADQAHLGNADPLVDAGFSTDGVLPDVCSLWGRVYASAIRVQEKALADIRRPDSYGCMKHPNKPLGWHPEARC
ncbi:hypothetical protein TPCV14_13670 [Cutibacterium avidum]|nr:hypothetical protein TPCV14_13670 [Cutibacterium avidum]